MESGKKKRERGGGRPSLYTPELAAKICELIAEGVSERKIGRMEGMPSNRTINGWKDRYPEFLQRSAKARRESAALFQERALAVAEEMSTIADQFLREDRGFPRGYIEAKRELIDQLTREAGLRDDRNFSDRKSVSLGGPAGGPVQVETTGRMDLSTVPYDRLIAAEKLLWGSEEDDPSPGDKNA